ncbi:hypothetical protein ACLOJK_024198, partial [Asimina triloba]
ASAVGVALLATLHAAAAVHLCVNMLKEWVDVVGDEAGEATPLRAIASGHERMLAGMGGLGQQWSAVGMTAARLGYCCRRDGRDDCSSMHATSVVGASCYDCAMPTPMCEHSAETKELGASDGGQAARAVVASGGGRRMRAAQVGDIVGTSGKRCKHRAGGAGIRAGCNRRWLAQAHITDEMGGLDHPIQAPAYGDVGADGFGEK